MRAMRVMNSPTTNTLLLVAGGGILLYLVYQAVQSVQAAQANFANASGSISDAARQAALTEQAYSTYGQTLTNNLNANLNTLTQAGKNTLNQATTTVSDYSPGALYDQASGAASDWWDNLTS